MALFDFLKPKPNTPSPVLDAISIFEENPGLDQREIMRLIADKVNDNAFALNLFRFIPMAYCRAMLPDVKLPDYYLTADSKGDFTKEHKLYDDPKYVEIERISKDRFKSGKNADKVMNILAFSSEFDAVNQALNAGADIKNLVFSPPLFT